MSSDEETSREGRWQRIQLVLFLVIFGGFLTFIGVGLYISFHIRATEARDEFSQQYSCPVDRITATKRSDLHARDFEAPRKPPPDIAADPARVAVWKSQQPKGWNATFFELEGCGHHMLWGCVRPGSQSSSGVKLVVVYHRDLDAPSLAE